MKKDKGEKEREIDKKKKMLKAEEEKWARI